jgi:hypothetical protein
MESDVNANTSALSECNETNLICNIIITFNETRLQSATDLAIARTTIHESLHAILVRMYEDGKLISQDGQPIVGYENLVNSYIDYLKGLPPNVNKAHHELMSEFIDDMATSLSIYDQNEFSFKFYKKLCWSGLTSTEDFLTLYPRYLDPNDEFNNPENFNPEWLDISLTIQSEKYNSIQSYSHPNGNLYEFNPKGYQPNTTAPCNE